jgi:hypothetical protein
MDLFFKVSLIWGRSEEYYLCISAIVSKGFHGFRICLVGFCGVLRKHRLLPVLVQQQRHLHIS